MTTLLLVSQMSATEPFLVPALSPQESLEQMHIAEGYSIELVASEPMIEEPVAIEWDADGKLYVAEMRTYMQDIDGTDELTPRSRVSLLEDTNDDGVMDKQTIFIDELLLPRMILCLDDRVIIRETNSLNLWAYRDTDGDGQADEKKLWHEGGSRGGNLEHQPSGLVWNIDNWIYTTYSRHRYRYTAQGAIRGPIPHGSGQWGIGKDDLGRLYYSTAGGEMPAMDFQQPIAYGQIRIPGEVSQEFRVCWPLAEIPDVQGGRGRLRDNDTLNWFTGVAGQSIFRGDRLPSDFYGDLIIPEPVGRLIRRAKVIENQGMRSLENAYPQKEFIASKDPNFRPVYSATGPDGCLYIVDMYRGIIQEGAWVRPGSYLRPVVAAYGLDKNVGRGRIYRIRHRDHERGPRPQLLHRSIADLASYLEHPNGWYRDTAQKLLVIRGDAQAAPRLREMALTSASPKARFHALWTLDGLSQTTPELLAKAIQDSDYRVRLTAVRIAESHASQFSDVTDHILKDAARDKEPNVAIQAILSAIQIWPANIQAIISTAALTHRSNKVVQGYVNLYKQRLQRRLFEEAQEKARAEAEQRKSQSLTEGKAIYTTLCFTCHGLDGQGAPMPGKPGEKMAPSLVDSDRVLGDKATLIRILLHGLVGDVDGVNYPQPMIAMGSNGDAFVANALSYIRHTWGHKLDLVTENQVAQVRRTHQGRLTPWTLQELAALRPPPLKDKKAWKLSASHNHKDVYHAIDDNPKTRYSTNAPQKAGMWYQVEFPSIAVVSQVALDTIRSSGDYPRGYRVLTSTNGRAWSEPVAQGVGTGPVTVIDFPPSEAKYLRIEQTGRVEGLFWSIHELSIN